MTRRPLTMLRLIRIGMALLLLLPCVAVGIAGYVGIRTYLVRGRIALPELIAVEASARLGREVRVGGADLREGRLTLTRVDIAEKSGLSAQAPMAAAAKVEIDYVLARILWRRTCEPIVPRIVVRGPVGHVRRDLSGRWNFEDVLPKPRASPTPPVIGEVVVLDGTGSYHDSLTVSRHPRLTPLGGLRADRISGKLRFYADGVDWHATGRCTSGEATALRCDGAYDRARASVLVVASARAVSVPVVAAAIAPAGLRATRGRADAQAAITWRIAPGQPTALVYRGAAEVRDADVMVPRVAEPVRGASGSVRVANDLVTFDIHGRMRPGPVHARGSVRDLRAPRVAVALEAHAVNVADLAAVAGIRQVGGARLSGSGAANLRATLVGTISRPALRVSSRVALGSVTAGRSTFGPGVLQIEVGGTLAEPVVMVRGTLDRATYGRTLARNVSLTGAYRGRTAAVEAAMSVASGRAQGSVEVDWRTGKARYAAAIRARDLALAALPQPAGHHIGGRADVDARVRGVVTDDLPVGTVDVQVYSPSWDKTVVQSARARVSSRTPGRLTVERLAVRDGEGHVDARGAVDVKARTLDLRVQADAIDLAAIAARGGSDSSPPVIGMLYLRSGRAVGPWRDPQISGVIHGYGLAYGDLDFEEADVSVRGTQSVLLVDRGRVVRAPAEGTFQGVLLNVLTDRPQVQVAGDFRDLELLDLSPLLRSSTDITGRARGTFAIAGDLQRPRVQVGPVDVQNAGIGDYSLDRLSASADFSPNDGQGSWRISALNAAMKGATLSASGTVEAGKRFDVSAELQGLDISVFNPQVSAYAVLGGTASAAVSISGSLTDGKAADLAGKVRADLTGASVNGVPVGAAQVRAQLTGDRVVPDREAGASAVLTLGPDTPWVRVNDGSRNPETNEIALSGIVDAMPVDALRQVFARSRLALEHAEMIPSEWLAPVGGHTPGTVSMSFAVAGPVQSPRASLTWSGTGLRPGVHALKTFTGSADVDARRLVLHQLSMRQTDAVLTASGSLEYGQAIDGALEVTGLTVEELRPWLPDTTLLHGLSGKLENLYISATGAPSSPAVTASLDARDIRWRVPSGTGGSVREIAVHSLRAARATVSDGRLTVDDVGIVLSNPVVQPPATTPAQAAGRQAPPQPTAPPPSEPRYEVHLSGDVGFAWARPFISDNAPTHVTLAIRNQQFPSGGTILKSVPIEIDGKLDAEVAFAGTWQQLRSPGTVRQGARQAPRWTGHVSLVADRVRYGVMQTVLSDVDAFLELTGTSVRVVRNPVTGRHFAARVDVINAVTGEVATRGEPLRVAGELPLESGGPGDGITLSTTRLPFAESPLPVFYTGRAVGAFAGISGRPAGVQLAIRGALYDPLIAGSLDLQRADILLPSTAPPPSRQYGPWFLRPRLDLSLHVGEQVRVRTALLTADVHTRAGAPVTLSGSAEAPRLNGTLLVDRGRMAFPTARFTIQRGGAVALRYPGVITTTEGQPGFDVLVDLTATSRLVAQSVFGARRNYTVTADIRGPLFSSLPDLSAGAADAGGESRGLRIDFRSNPPDLALSRTGLQDKMLGILGGQQAISELFAPRGQVARVIGESIFSAVSTGVLPDFLERSGITRALGFEELALAYGEVEGPSVYLTRPLLGPLSLTFWRRFSGSRFGELGVWELKLSAQLGNHLQTSWSVDDQRTNVYLMEGVYRF